MRAPLALLAALLAGCGPEPTSLLVHIDAPSLTITQLTVSATFGATVRSRDLSRPTLPGNLKLILPDVAQPVTIALAAVDDQHRNWTASDTTAVTPHHQASLSLRLGPPAPPGDDMGGSPGEDMAGAADMARPQLTLLAGVPGGGPDDCDGQGGDARLASPRGVALFQGSIYVAEDYTGKIRKVTPDGAVTTLPLIDGSSGAPVDLYTPWGLVADGKGNLYASSWNGCGVYRIRLSDNAVFTLTGGNGVCDQYVDGSGANARFGVLEGIAIDDARNLWVTDPVHHALRLIAFDGSGNVTVTTPAGLATTGGMVDGAGNAGGTTGPARLDTPHSIYFHAGKIYFGDGGAFRMLDPAAGNQVSTITKPGDNGGIGGIVFDATASRFVVVDRFGVLRQIVPGMPPTNTIIAGDRNDDFAVDGVGLQARFNDLDFMTIDPQPGGKIWLSDGTALRSVDPASAAVKTIAGTPSHNRERDQPALLNGPGGVAFDGQHTVYFVDHWGGVVRQYDFQTGLTTTLAGDLNQPDAVAFDGQQLWIACEGSSTIAKMTLADRKVTTVAGSGSAAPPPAFDLPTALVLDGDHTLYIADGYNHLIRTLDTQSGAVGTLAGTGSQGVSEGDFASATFDFPHGLALDRARQLLYVADAAAATVRVLDLGQKTTRLLAGRPYDGEYVDGALADGRLNGPHELWLDAAAQQLYVADRANHAVRIVDLGARTIRTLVGDGKPLTQPGPLPARVHSPWGLAMTPMGLVISSYAENALLLAR
jgi:sugar lactone lactonase YvrE